jgi:nicotinate-nucleotide pyrophosphorylase (carboxylating)
MLPDFYTDDIIKLALQEDICYIDVTTDLLIDSAHQSTARLVAKEEEGLVLAGLAPALRVFAAVDSSIDTRGFAKDCDLLKKGDVIAEITGSTAAILKAERVSLNILQHMCGIATYTRACVDKVNKVNAERLESKVTYVADTRKTLPGLRALQKYAVFCGGGTNHRFNLSAAAMIKDNHIAAHGSIAGAVKSIREKAGHTVVIEVETQTLAQVKEAVTAGADIVMLDNMSPYDMKTAVKLGNGRVLFEASGNITLDNIAETARTRVDVISVGALTHSVRAADISLQLRSR